jgi:hypothetical protein
MSSSVLNVSSQNLAHSQRELDAYRPEMGTRESLENILSSKQLLYREPSIAGWDQGFLDDSDGSEDDGPNEFLITRQASKLEELTQDDDPSAQEVSAPNNETQTAKAKIIEPSITAPRPVSANKNGRRISSQTMQKPGRQSTRVGAPTESRSRESCKREPDTAHKIPPVMYTEEPRNLTGQIYEREVCGQ